MSTATESSVASDRNTQFLRHTLATLAYRGGKVLRGAPADFSTFTCGEGCRSAGAVLAHMCDLLDWALSIASGKQAWRNSELRSWKEDADRFHSALTAFDAYLASGNAVQAPVEQLFQGPVADALTHVGQLAMMRRLAGSPIRGENFFVSEIVIGRTTFDQAAPKREF